MTALVSKPRRAGRFWVYLPVALLAAMLAGWGAMITIAMDDPAFGIEPDYYDKAVDFDAHRVQVEESQRLGWTLALHTQPMPGGAVALGVDMRDRSAAPLDDGLLVATAFHNARSSDRVELSLSGRGEGRYEGHLDTVRPGLWEFRFSFERGADRFVQVVRRDLGAP